jgi:hypothetical protein
MRQSSPKPPVYSLDDLRVKQLRQRHPVGLRGGVCGLATWRVYPVPIVGEQRCHVLLEAISLKEWRTLRSKTWVT